MKNFRCAVNRFLLLPEPAAAAGSLATTGFPASRAPASGARKSEILASPATPCKRYFDEYDPVHEIARTIRHGNQTTWLEIAQSSLYS